MLVTKKRLYTELCKVMDTVHEIITCVELEKHHRKADVEDIKLAIEPMHAHLIHLENRVAALESKKHHKSVKKITKAKDKTVKMYVIHRFLDGKHMFDTICNTKKQLNTEIANVVADTRVWATDHGVKNAGSGKVTYKTRTVTDQGE